MAKFIFLKKENLEKIPPACGVYCFKSNGEYLYIGKAANLRQRIKNHFLQPAFRDTLFLDKVKKVGYILTNSEIEALILEAKLIKKIQPKFNIVWKDSKNYFFVAFSKEKFPTIFVTHQPSKLDTKKFSFVGPFVEGTSLKKTLAILRKIFPFRSCKTLPKKPCFWATLKRCPAPCQLKSYLSASKILEKKIEKECKENAKKVRKILEKGKDFVLKKLKKEIEKAVKKEDFERATKIRDEIFALEKVLAHAHVFSPEMEIDWPGVEKKLRALLKTKRKIERIEGFDVSNIQGKMAVGSMVAFLNGKPEKSLYRKFKIKFTFQPNDIKMLKEVLQRRFSHLEWGLPQVIFIDGGKAQLNAAISVKNQTANKKIKEIKIISLAKGKNQLFVEGKKEPILLNSLDSQLKFLILRLRDEAHRFAIKFHRKVREKIFFKK